MKPLKHITYSRLYEVGVKAMLVIGHLAHSYDLLETLMRDASKDYVRQLGKYLHTDDPIMVAHSEIASRFLHLPLNNFFDKVGAMRVRNVRGGYSNVAVWKRIK